MNSLLEVKGLTTTIRTDDSLITVVDGVNLNLAPGETLGLVGESGSGKSMTALSIMGLLPRPDSAIASGSVKLEGRELRGLSARALASIRGVEVSMIFQDPMTALNPVQKIGRQIGEALTVHGRYVKDEAKRRARVLELLQAVGIPDPAIRRDSYPHQLSGGMRQRVMIAIALACEPRLLIADEPTTALDVTVQAQILRLIKRLQAEHGTALLFITHDLALVSQLSDRVAVMYAGQIVESAPSDDLFAKPLHPYTKALLAASPSADVPVKEELPTIPGTVAKPGEAVPACRFANRCLHAIDRCHREPPEEEAASANHKVRCLRWRELS